MQILFPMVFFSDDFVCNTRNQRKLFGILARKEMISNRNTDVIIWEDFGKQAVLVISDQTIKLWQIF